MPAKRKDIAEMLAELGYSSVDAGDGNLAVDVVFDDGRRQTVFVAKECETIDKVAFRHIWSPAFSSSGKISDKLAYRLLANSHGRIFGSWVLDEKSKAVYFSAKVIDNFTARQLDTMITAIASDADNMEKKLVGKDEL